MYVYCGHGSGEQYVPLPMMRHLDGRCPAALLVGCSSGRLRRQRGSQYDPQGAVISYLMSGVCVCVCMCGGGAILAEEALHYLSTRISQLMCQTNSLRLSPSITPQVAPRWSPTCGT